MAGVLIERFDDDILDDIDDDILDDGLDATTAVFVFGYHKLG